MPFYSLCYHIIDGERVTLESGKIYLRGAVRDVEKAELIIPVNTTVRIGVWYVESTITELEDPSLRDPAVGTRNYQEVGAARTKITITWDYQAEGVTTSFKNGEFYPIYNVENGVLIQHAPPPQANAVNTALARYDREANGSYVVNGLGVMFLQKEERDSKVQQVFVVNEGKAHVEGYEIELPHSMRIRFDEDPDIKQVESEPHTFQPSDKEVMELKLSDTPVTEITKIDITVQKTVTLTHGSYSGTVDPIPDSAILEIIQVKQGSTIYVKGTDYRLDSGKIDWSPPGGEPAPGSSYEVTYRARTRVTAQNKSEKGCKISGAVDGTLVLVDYSWKMPRYDLITIDMGGVVRRIKGIAHPWRPSIPKAPAGQLALSYVYQQWKDQENPSVINNAIHVVPMSDLEAMRSSISNLYALVAQERLRNYASFREPTAKKGVFVDPFFDDDMRDQGISQTAAIVDMELTLPIKVTVADVGKGTEPWVLPYELEPILEQPLQTMEMKINPYQAFAPVPAKVTISLNIDRWTELKTNWSSPVTRRFSVTSSPITKEVILGASNEQSRSTQSVLIGTETSETMELLNSRSNEIAFMREITQNFEIEGFSPGEELKELKFDGIPITPIA
ncbi:DUF4815 domain-containing protein [Wolbachia endosymbiont of Drosophila tsacasi]|uniref:DUF4815 domain-containing protein n=1 Tax=Wolbachia endosymbiont of Drosophila tsacasi TaxID=3002579 RepID=UPI0023A99454|nr:DUF4815 domain-containing protein [Wolbachia endosymbiont of Drosophila tsacasi]MDE5062653.1 DUF4815 domain-containing protein [Wolbachia endosymbiont of Drosophila tsacasi]